MNAFEISLADRVLISKAKSNEKSRHTSFDHLLLTRWKTANDQGIMRYHFQKLKNKQKILAGKNNLNLQLNEQRGEKKRNKLTNFSSTREPVNTNCFNFNRVRKEEIITRLQVQIEQDKKIEALLLVNDAPFELASSLLIPQPEMLLPQLANQYSIAIAIAIIASSSLQSLRVGFNGLCAGASVNHAHWHVYLHEDSTSIIGQLPIQNYVLQDWIVPCLAFEIDPLNEQQCFQISHFVDQLLNKVLNLHLCESSILHPLSYNLLLLRNDQGNRIRFMLWPRWAEMNVKSSMEIEPAICELGGLFICKRLEQFNNLTEIDCIKLIQKYALDSKTLDLVLKICTDLQLTDNIVKV